MFATLIGFAWVASASAQAVPPRAAPDRLLVEEVPGRSLGVPTALVVQLKKDLGDSEFLPKTVELLAQALKAERLSLVDPKSPVSARSFPKDVEFYWLTGPDPGACGSGGCSGQLSWASVSTGTSARLFPTTLPEEGSAFNSAPMVLPRSHNGLFDVELSEASNSHPGSRGPDEHAADTLLAFDGHRYIIQIKKSPSVEP